MRSIIKIFFVCIFVFFSISVFAQTHISVPLGNHIYNILEQAEARGLCSPLSGVRPYTQAVVIAAIKEILDSENAGKLRAAEREILERYLARFSRPTPGINWLRGGWYGETSIGKDDTRISANVGVTADIEASSGIYLQGDTLFGTEIWAQLYINGDLGNSFSYGFNYEGGLMQAPRRELGEYNTYYEGFYISEGSRYWTLCECCGNRITEYENQLITTYSEPLTHFPYTYQKRWDGSVYFFDTLSTFDSWPTTMAGGYNLTSELTASFLENKLIMRIGRISHDWGSIPIGSSLAFNKMARPFVGVETEFNPVPWFGFASLTGVLEYNNTDGLKVSSATFQNAFSIIMLQFRIRNYLFIDFVDAVVWPKRFELGYISPITNNFFYQNNIGDFDNMAIALNIRAQYPGLGSIWFSLFVDEMTFLADLFTLDRQMFAWQVGMSFPLPIMSFSSVKLSYTKINPYCYTHNRNFTPWYGDLRMETAYINNGVSLGYYLPPNSDEILVRFNTMPAESLIMNLQYQMIRRGADFGSSAVDGSNLLSELDPANRSTNPVLRRFFLRDGAYQWMHVIRLGGEWTPARIPLAFFFEAGTVISYFTNTEEPANSGEPHPYSIIDTSEYPKSTSFIVKLGIRLFPK
jgi:hypothetical protein